MAKKLGSRRDDELEAEVRELERLAREAETAQSFTAAVQARAKASTLKAELARRRDEAAAARERDPLKRVRRLQRRAAEDGSWVAASQLLRQEQELAEQLEAEARARREEERLHQDDNALVAEVVANLRSLPEGTRQKILAALAEG
ncbi:MAG: hypothetical protein FJ102_24750 [Deltaproteobacteria bacterium]|nr:hypothetical protein [Deltaproteobacteria bacterium]